jgi:hypothetical protein
MRGVWTPDLNDWILDFNTYRPVRRATRRDRNMFSIRHTDSSGEPAPSLEMLPGLYDELRTADREHGDVSVTDEESAWVLSAHRNGVVVLENLENGGERHMKDVPKQKVLELWRTLIAGDLDALLGEPWTPGYG